MQELLDNTIWTDQDERFRQEFSRLAQNCETQSLARLALQVAVSEYPPLLIEPVLDRVVEMVGKVRSALPDDASDGDKIKAIIKLLFETLKFRGDHSAYFDPTFCYLNEVLDRRVGLPITLCILFLDIADRLSLPMSGIGLPGHFIIGYRGGSASEIFVDPFNKGAIMTRLDCERLVHRLTGGRLPWHDDYLREVTNRHIVTRLLNNLKGSYARTADTPRSLRIQNYLLTLHPDAAHEFRDRARILTNLQSFRGALGDLKTYLKLAPNAPDADEVRAQTVDLEKRVRGLC